ncbi:MAG: M48 family metallopeptidase [Pseudomonadota bacterium]|nr:M48 family metallopeptidase [Pseudomonadota bacterium]
MMQPDSMVVRFYDGQRAAAREALLYPADAGVAVVVDGQRTVFRHADMLLIGAVGQIKPAIELPHEARIEFLQTDLPTWVLPKAAQRQHHLWRLERSPLLIVCSVLLVIGFVWGLTQYGVPIMAKSVATHLPAQTLSRLGDQAQAQLEEMTEPSTLIPLRQQQLRALYAQYLDPEQAEQMIFRQGKGLGANAFALPNGRIVLTDELVDLAKNDYELLAVMAHEQGHVALRHSLQQAISGLSISLMIAWMTGDSSDLLIGVPTAILALNYSRDFEREADQYAMQQLQQANVSVQYLADFLKRLAAEHAEAESAESTEENSRIWQRAGRLLQSHPATDERVAAIEAVAAQQVI